MGVKNSVHRGVCPIACCDTPLAPWEQTPYRDQAPPLWEQTPPPLPGKGIPWRSACWEIRATSRRYASYWNEILFLNHLIILAVADLHSKILDAPPPRGSKFFQFHAVFGKFWRNRMLAPPPRGVGAPSSGKS